MTPSEENSADLERLIGGLVENTAQATRQLSELSHDLKNQQEDVVRAVTNVQSLTKMVDDLAKTVHKGNGSSLVSKIEVLTQKVKDHAKAEEELRQLIQKETDDRKLLSDKLDEERRAEKLEDRQDRRKMWGLYAALGIALLSVLANIAEWLVELIR